MLGKLFQRVSEAPTNPQVQRAAGEFDVADLYRGPVQAEEPDGQVLALDEKLRQAYFWIVNHAVISPFYDIEYQEGPPQTFVFGDAKGALTLPSGQSYSSFVLLPLLTFAVRAKCLLIGGPGRGKTSSAILMGVLAGYSLRDVRRAIQEWIGLMARLAPHCDSVPQWLDAGKLAAWRTGLVQYRSTALRIAHELPWRLSALVLDASCDIAETDWRQRLAQLETDRWYLPQTNPAATVDRSLRIVRTTGGFRGFGGPCLRPPTVRAQGDALFVFDGDAAWQLLADAFGTLWQRTVAVPSGSAASDVPLPTTLDASGRLTWGAMQQQLGELACASSFACDGQTLAVTLPTSHYVFLVARTSTGHG